MKCEVCVCVCVCGGGVNFVCVLEALKNRCGMEYRTKGLINEPGWLALQRSWYLG